MQAGCELDAMRWRVLTDVPRSFYVYRISLRRLDVAQRLIYFSARSTELTPSLVEEVNCAASTPCRRRPISPAPK